MKEIKSENEGEVEGEDEDEDEVELFLRPLPAAGLKIQHSTKFFPSCHLPLEQHLFFKFAFC
ncbi:MAG: hypothetical protein JJE55_12985 [Flavobacteriaceae bacterium]|nr:hypothetical protein [Flavobacteriaceae bacterium]